MGGVGPTQHVDGGKPVIDIDLNRLNISVAEALRQPPPIVGQIYEFSLSRDRMDLTIDPRQQNRPVMRSASRGFSARDSENGGKVIRLEGGPFKNATWITSSFDRLVKGDSQRSQLERAGYSLGDARQLLVVNGEGDNNPTVFAFSRDPSRPGLVAVCSEVTVLDFDANGGGGGGGMVTIRKPVIYLYPERPTDVRVEVSLKGEFVAQYPKAKNGVWNVHASPDGNLFDRGTERHYSYLFWEGTNDTLKLDPAQAFCVASRDAELFLEKACTAYALNAKEKTDFISYWLPHLEKNSMSLVQFLSVEEYEKYATMRITPEPTTTIRMFMVFEKAHGMERVGNPELPKLERKGYTVVEWGGANLDEKIG